MAKEDTSWIILAHKLSEQYLYVNLDSSEYYAKEILNRSDEIEYNKGMRFAYEIFGGIALFKNDMEAARENYLLSLDFALKTDHYNSIIITYRILGNIDYTLGNFPEALEFWMQGNRLAKEHDYFDIIPEFYSNIGNLYYQTREYEKAKEYFILAQQSAEDNNIVDLIPNSLNNLAFIEKHYENYDLTRDYALQVLELIDSIPNTINFVPVAYQYLGNVSMHEKDYQESLRYFKLMLKSLDDVEPMYYGPSVIDEARAYRWIGESYLNLNQFSDAEQNLTKAFKISTDANILEIKSDVAVLLSELYEKEREFAKSLDYYKIFHANSDSILSDDKIREITEIQMEQEFKDRQHQLALEQARKDALAQKRELFYTTGFIVALLVVMILILAYRLQRSKTKRARLAEEKSKIELDFKNQELTSNVLSILKKNELLINLTQKLKKARITSKASNKPLIDQMIREIKLSSQEIGWDEFELSFKEVHADFYSQLGKRFPDLTSNELRLCAMLKLNMSTKDIASITYKSSHSIDVARLRMRKKMGIDKNDSLKSIINQL
jgi:tetratricopeptide (TPR) repeat protein